MDTRRFFIKPPIPKKIQHLQELAFNVWSYWDRDAQNLFHRLDPELFRRHNRNPSELLYRLNPSRLQAVAEDKGFLHELKKVHEKFTNYMHYEGHYQRIGSEVPFSPDDTVAYVCMEYGLHESIPIYSGGLAILAGDQLKAVSDAGFPMVSFGLLYNYGYFAQKITPDGTQIEEFHKNAWYLNSLTEVRDTQEVPVVIEIPLKNDRVFAKLWRIQVGRVPLYLLDTNIHQNAPQHRGITDTLYDSDRRTRLKQELVLGRGAVLALRALGIQPKVYHLNEGHTAFVILERLLHLTRECGLTLEEAKAVVRFSTVFTTHTPVIEGNEHFADDLIKEYLAQEIGALHMTLDEFLSLGKVRKEKEFWLPALALRHARRSNAVSKLHTSVTRTMWQDLFSTLHEKEFPIGDVTNGVHLQSWLSRQLNELFTSYLGPDYFRDSDGEGVWQKINTIPDSEIWNAHVRRKEQVISFIRKRLSQAMMQRGYRKSQTRDLEEILNPNNLTIGFARRFAPYKRADLILSDEERLVSILTDKERPVQFVFAGKAHPADSAGKALIKKIFDFVERHSLENRIVFIEDYDINVARHMVQGVDVWLNTPLKPLEASGTSGMKAGINGVLNLSLLDGWWPEGYNGENGWAIPASTNLADPNLGRSIEANQIYDLLEGEITKLFYRRTDNDLPLDWIKMMKSSIVSICGNFTMQQVLHKYVTNYYLPLVQEAAPLGENNYALLKSVSQHKKIVDSVWSTVYIKDYFTSIDGKAPVSGETVSVDCYVYLGDVDPSLLRVEIFYCGGEEENHFKTFPLSLIERYQDKVSKYSANFTLEGTGLQELSVRLVPENADFRKIYPEYVKWKL